MTSEFPIRWWWRFVRRWAGSPAKRSRKKTTEWRRNMAYDEEKRTPQNRNDHEGVVILAGGRHFEKEHRIRNQVRAVAGRHAVFGYGASGLDALNGFRQVRMPPRIPYRFVKLMGAAFPGARLFYEARFFRPLADEIRATRPRLIIAHDILDGLVAQSARLPFVFDSHEYLPRQFDGTLLWRVTEIRYRRRALRQLFRHASLVTVEGETVAEAYGKDFPTVRGKTLVVRNTPAYAGGFGPEPPRAGKRRMIHHGIIVPERGLERLVEVMESLGSAYELTLMGDGPEAYLAELRRKAERAGNVFFKAPVPYERIVETIYGYDLSLMFFGSKHYHHKYMTVPNKFWESLQARVPVVVSPSSAMARYVRETGCGVVAAIDSVPGYVNAVRSLTEDEIVKMKARLEEMAFAHSSDAWLGQYLDVLLERTAKAPDIHSALVRAR